MKTYKIIRFRQGEKTIIIQTGLTLEEAQAHCQDKGTRGLCWFDGYTEE